MMEFIVPIVIVGGFLLTIAAVFIWRNSKLKAALTPAPTTPATVDMDPNKWVFQYSPGMGQPAADVVGWKFDFPTHDGVHYLVHETSGYLTGPLTLKATCSGVDGDLVETQPGVGTKPAVRIYFQRRGDDLTGDSAYYRWWSKNAVIPGTVDITETLDPAKWISVFGESGDNKVAEFQAAAKDVQAVGMTFGGNFAGHGVYSTGPVCTFNCTDFRIN